MNFRSVIAAPTIAALLAACGGGLETTTISADRWMYNSATTITVTGPNLDKGISLVAPNCSGIAEVTASATATQKVYTCTPVKTGAMVVTAIGGNAVLHATTYNVPIPQVSMKTSMGDIVMELDPTSAPVSVKNFLQYVSDSFYSNLIFHRVIPNFVIQAGGFDAAMVQATTRAAIKLEVPNGLSNLRGTVAMARSSALDSATSQFYINTIDNTSLDTLNGGYAVFGKVLTGLETVDAISAVPTAVASGMSDVPVTPVVITSMVQTQ